MQTHTSADTASPHLPWWGLFSGSKPTCCRAHWQSAFWAPSGALCRQPCRNVLATLPFSLVTQPRVFGEKMSKQCCLHKDSHILRCSYPGKRKMDQNGYFSRNMVSTCSAVGACGFLQHCHGSLNLPKTYPFNKSICLSDIPCAPHRAQHMAGEHHPAAGAGRQIMISRGIGRQCQ